MATLTLTPGLAQSLADAVRSGVPLGTAAVAAGVSRQAVEQWTRAGTRGTWDEGTPVDPASQPTLVAFVSLIAQARAEFEAKQIAAIAQAAQERNLKTGALEWRAGAWLLNNHPTTRETYREHREVEVHQTGSVDHVVRQLVEQASPEQLDVWEAALDALDAPHTPHPETASAQITAD